MSQIVQSYSKHLALTDPKVRGCKPEANPKITRAARLFHLADVRLTQRNRKGGKNMTRQNRQDDSKATRLEKIWGGAWTARFNALAGNQKDALVSALRRAAHNQLVTVDEQKMLAAFTVKWFDVPAVACPLRTTEPRRTENI